MTVTLTDIEAARRTIGAQVLRTPMLPAPKLSALTGREVWVKYENLQVTNSFKERGAVNKLAALGAEERARGVIAMSAGNHAQAVAYHARRMKIPATIVMPVTTPFVKVAATEAYGATVVLDGEAVSDAPSYSLSPTCQTVRSPMRRKNPIDDVSSRSPCRVNVPSMPTPRKLVASPACSGMQAADQPWSALRDIAYVWGPTSVALPSFARAWTVGGSRWSTWRWLIRSRSGVTSFGASGEPTTRLRPWVSSAALER